MPLKWIALLCVAGVYGGLQVASSFTLRRETAQMNAVYCPVACLNGAIEQWDVETRTKGSRVPTMDELSPYLKPQGKLPSMIGEIVELPEIPGESARAILPRRLLGFPAGTKVLIVNGRLRLGVQRPGKSLEFWKREEQAGLVPFYWMVR